MPKRSWVGNDSNDIVSVAEMLLYATVHMLDRLCRPTNARLWRTSNLCIQSAKVEGWHMADKFYYFLYRTTNLVNGKYYKGQHSTNDLFDGYLGSGLAFLKAVAKYGKNNFKRQIVLFLPDFETLQMAEKLYITKEDIASDMCYNLTAGGASTNTETRAPITEATREKQSIARSRIANKKATTKRLNNNYTTRDKTGAIRIRGTRVKAGTRQVFCAELGTRYVSINTAAIVLGLQRTNIFAACKNKNIRCGGFHWFFPDEYTEAELQKLHEQYKLKAIKDAGFGCFAGRAIQVYCVETGVLFPSYKSAGLSVSRAATHIRNAVFKRGLCGGYHWMLKEDYERMTLVQHNPEETSCNSPSAESSE